MNSNGDAKVVDGNVCDGGATPKRPHWRHRDRSATAVYVVHPDQFRAVVQQLTGASAPTPAHGCSGGDGGADQQRAAMAVEASKKGKSSGGVEQRTLAQMHHDCMAWADEC